LILSPPVLLTTTNLWLRALQSSILVAGSSTENRILNSPFITSMRNS
jgi:hypothetical protein